MTGRTRARSASSSPRSHGRFRHSVALSAAVASAVAAWPAAAWADQFVVTKAADGVIDARGLVLDSTVAAYGIGINGNSFTNSAITTVNGWQYTAYWVRTGTTAASNYVAVARRPVGSAAWQVANLNASTFTNGLNGTRPSDAHNVVSFGIDETDGSIHLAYDLHNRTLRYRVSTPGVTTNPNAVSAAQWSQSLFAAERNWLTGSNAPVADVTYPHFVTGNDGKLQLTYRTGSSGNGSNWLAGYDATTKTWAAPRQYDDGRVGTYTGTVTAADPNRNSYINGLTYGKSGRLYQSFTWREGATGAANHDIGFVYSDDKGRTWKNNAGAVVGNTATGQKWNVFTPGLTVVPLDENQSLMNQQAQAVSGGTAADEKFHALMWHRDTAKADTGGVYAPTESSYFHYWRDNDGNFHRGKLPGQVGSRPKLFFDGNDNAFAVYQVGAFSSAGIYINNGDLVIAAASKATNWNDWKVIKTEAGPFVSEAQADARLFALNGTLSVLMQNALAGTAAAGATNMRALDYTFAVAPAANVVAAASGSWLSTATWGGAVPTNNVNAVVDGGRTVSLNSAFASLTGSLVLGTNGTAGDFVVGANSTLNVNNLIVGRDGPGNYIQTGGTVTAWRMAVGDYFNETSTSGINFATVGGGTLTVGELQVATGHGSGGSQFTTTGTAAVVVNGEVLLGDLGNDATLHVNGGNVTVHGDVREGLSGSDRSTVIVTAGTLDTTGNAIRADRVQLNGGTIRNTPSVRTLNGFGGSLVPNATLAVEDGDFVGSIQDGTAVAAINKVTAGTLTLGGNSTYGGVTTINAGVLRAASDNALGSTTGNTVVPGGTSTARLELVGGVTTAEPLSLGGRQPNVATSTAPHVLNVGGTNTLAGNLATAVGGNQYNVASDGGTLVVTGRFVNNGTGGATDVRTLNLGGTADGAWRSVIADNANNAAVTAVTKRDPGTWSLTAANTYTGPTAVLAGTLRAGGAAVSPLLNGVGGVDLSAGATLELEYTATSPAATVRSILRAAQSSGFANGRIRSPALPDGLTIGYADDAGRVTVRVTLPGDSDLDGDVDFTDFVALQSGFGATDARFDQGDFDFDGAVTFTDFVALQANFGAALSARGVAVTAAEAGAVQRFALANAVPEPATAGVCAVAATMALRRRRR